MQHAHHAGNESGSAIQDNHNSTSFFYIIRLKWPTSIIHKQDGIINVVPGIDEVVLTPYLYILAALTTKTAVSPACKTLSVTLPKTHRPMPERPCVDIDIRSISFDSA